MVETHHDIGIRSICPEDFGSFSLRAYVPEGLDLSHLYSDGGRLNDTATLSAEEFIDLIVNRDAPCVETPESIWGITDW
jgi:hypothetical protein